MSTRGIACALRKQSGFTLVEVMLSVAILLAIVLPMWQWQERMAFARAEDRYEYDALVLMQRLADQTSAGYDADLLPSLKEHGEVERAVDGFRCIWSEVFFLESLPGGSDLLQLQLSICWRDAYGKQKERSLWIVVEDGR